MALRITDLAIDVDSLGGDFILTDIRPYYQYKDGERTEKIDGYRYAVALPHKKMEKLNIKVEQKSPLIDTDEEEIPIGQRVDFENLEVGSYFMKGNINISAKAKKVFLVD